MSECFAISSVQKLPLPSHFQSVSTDRNRLCAQSINYSNKLDPCSVATQSAATITLNYLHLSPGSSTGRTLLSTSTMLENAWKTPGAQFHSFPLSTPQSRMCLTTTTTTTTTISITYRADYKFARSTLRLLRMQVLFGQHQQQEYGEDRPAATSIKSCINFSRWPHLEEPGQGFQR